MRFEFANWLTKRNPFNRDYNNNVPVPMRVMFGQILRETDKCYYVQVYGKPEPTAHCLHCMRKLTHKVSQFYGLGPVCGKHYYITNITEENLEEHFEEIRQKMKEITWRGLVPKHAVKKEYEDIHIIAFEYEGKEYRVKTSDKTKVKEIHNNAKVLGEKVTKG